MKKIGKGILNRSWARKYWVIYQELNFL